MLKLFGKLHKHSDKSKENARESPEGQGSLGSGLDVNEKGNVLAAIRGEFST